MFGPTPFRDIILVAGFELRDLTRSRRALLFAVLYMLIAALGAYIFSEIVSAFKPYYSPPPRVRIFGGGQPRGTGRQGANGQSAQASGSASTAAASSTEPAPPNATNPDNLSPDERARRNDERYYANLPAAQSSEITGTSEDNLFSPGSPFWWVLRTLISDPESFNFVTSQPPITLFHFWISFALMPFVVMITSSESIAQEIQSRGVRFVQLRTGRGEFVIGKVVGQAVTIALLTLLASAVCMGIGWWKLTDFHFWPSLVSMFLFWPRLACFLMAYLGLAALCSMNSSSPVSSRVFAIIGMASLAATHGFAELYATVLPPDSAQAKVWKCIDYFTPSAHQADLWHVQPSYYMVAMATHVGLGMLYVGIGLVFYNRRDL